MFAPNTVVFIFLLWVLQFSCSYTRVSGTKDVFNLEGRREDFEEPLYFLRERRRIAGWVPPVPRGCSLPDLSARCLGLTGKATRANMQGFGGVGPWDVEETLGENSGRKRVQLKSPARQGFSRQQGRRPRPPALGQHSPLLPGDRARDPLWGRLLAQYQGAPFSPLKVLPSVTTL